MKKKKKPDRIQGDTRTVHLTDKKMVEILPYILDDNCVGFSEGIRTGYRRFSVRVYLQKKTSHK